MLFALLYCTKHWFYYGNIKTRRECVDLPYLNYVNTILNDIYNEQKHYESFCMAQREHSIMSKSDPLISCKHEYNFQLNVFI